MGLLHVGLAGLGLPTSGDPPASASQNAGITGMSHCARPNSTFYAALCPFLEKPKCSFSFDRDERTRVNKQEVKCTAVLVSVELNAVIVLCRRPVW